MPKLRMPAKSLRLLTVLSYASPAQRSRSTRMENLRVLMTKTRTLQARDISMLSKLSVQMGWKFTRTRPAACGPV